jgi:glyoxylase-like metal-dependent hydrolase (beta-lactamase superfamily II)
MMAPIRIELPTEFQLNNVNAYLFAEPEPVLVDTGVKSAETLERLQTALAAHGLALADLRRMIITHPHVDHFGAAAAIAAHSDATIWVAAIGREWVLDFGAMWRRRMAYYRDDFLRGVGLTADTIEMVMRYMAALTAMCDPVPAERIRTFGLDDTLELGGRSWQVLHTPGHATMQTCFYQPETGCFLSADMLLHKTPTPIVEQPPDTAERIPALPQFLNSLKLVEALDISVVYPGHGEPFSNYREVIERQRARIHRRKEECYHHVAAGHRTVNVLVELMYGRQPLQHRFAGLWMLVGYLDLLHAEGRVEEEEVNGVWHYTVQQSGGRR